MVFVDESSPTSWTNPSGVIECDIGNTITVAGEAELFTIFSDGRKQMVRKARGVRR
jgi:hypothetical protein